MAAPQRLLATVLLLVYQGIHCTPPLPAWPVTCLRQKGPLLNCSSSGLSLPPQIQSTVTELDVSHNLLKSFILPQPNHNLRKLWLGNNRIADLSLCIESTNRSQYDRGGQPHLFEPWIGKGCVSWAPALQLLSVERNQLIQLPEGLKGSESLHVLQLSYNRISTLQPGDLSHLQQLTELHLQHNFITTLHPETIKDLSQLSVLDLSFNLLITLPPLTYLFLRDIGAEVKLHGNRWQCDCSIRSVRRLMAYDTDRGKQTWSLVCASPSIVSGRDLLQLEEDDLLCFNADRESGVHQDVTVDKGSEILLPCSTQQESTWWTPNGQVSVRGSQAGLLISNTTERDTGLYMCVPESQQESVSVFNLKVRNIGETKRTSRPPRSLPRDSQLIIPQGIMQRMGQTRKNNQSDLALAVSLSVVITFLVAFILGVLARPLIDVLWRRVCTKKRSSSTSSVSSVEQRPYVNEAYSDGEEHKEISTHRERRVTFSSVDVRAPNNGHYYDTIAGSNQGIISEKLVMECELTDANQQKYKSNAGDSGSVRSSQQANPEDNPRGERDLSVTTNPTQTNSMGFENIPDTVDVEESRSLSSHSSTSHSGEESKGDEISQEELQSPWSTLEKDPFKQTSKSQIRPTEVPQISIEDKNKIPEFVCEPFMDWSPHTNKAQQMDPDLWNDSGENFEFTDSIQGSSARSSSLFGSFKHSNQEVLPSSHDLKRSDSSSSSSNVSGDEPTQYIVNPEGKEEEDVEVIHNTKLTNDTAPKKLSLCFEKDVSFEHQAHGEDQTRPPLEGFTQTDYSHYIERPQVGQEQSDFFHSSDSDDEPIRYTVNQEKVEEDEKEWEDSKFEKPVSSMVTIERDRAKEICPMAQKDLEPKGKFPGFSLGAPYITKHLDIRTSSSLKANSSSSSSENEAEPIDHEGRQKRNRTKVTISGLEQNTCWPDLENQSIPKIKRRIDFKAPSPPPDSSSNSGDTKEDVGKQEKGKLDKAKFLFEKSVIVSSHEPKTRWPKFDLSNIPRIKKRLDIKALSLPPGSSSSGESDEETKELMEETLISDVTHEQSPPNVVSLSPTKAVRTDSDESANSTDNEEEDPRQDFSSSSIKMQLESESRWPDLNLRSVPHIKRHLDTKAPSLPDLSLSGSERENGYTGSIEKLERDKVDVVIRSYEPETKKSDLSLSIPKVKRHLDIKALLSIQAESPSSSSESKNDFTKQTVKQERIKADVGITSYEPEKKWPNLDKGVPRIKRRLDITAPSPQPALDLSGVAPGPAPPESNSFDSESEDEKKNLSDRLEQEVPIESRTPKKEAALSTKDILKNISITPKRDHDIGLENYASITDELEDKSTVNNMSPEAKVNLELELRWAGPSLGFSRFRKRLEITSSDKDTPLKVPSLPEPELSSSSSESEDEGKCSSERQKTERVELEGVSYQESYLNPEDEPVKDYGFLTTEMKSGQGKALAGFSVPHLKRRLYVKAPEEALPAPLSLNPQPPDSSPSSSDSEDKATSLESHGWRETAQLTDVMNKVSPQSPVSNFYPVGTVNINPDLNNQTSKMETELESKWPELNPSSGIPQIKRRLYIVQSPPQSKSSSSNESEDETTDQSLERDRADMGTTGHEGEANLMDFSLGVLRNKRHPNIKVQSPKQANPPNSREESEEDMSGHTAKQMDSSEITYKDSSTANQNLERKWPELNLSGIPSLKRRLDIKAPALPSSNVSASSSESETTDSAKQEKKQAEKISVMQKGLPVSVEGKNVSLAPRPPTISFDDAAPMRNKQDKHSPDEDLYSEIRLTSGDHLSDFPITRYMDEVDQPSQEAPAVVQRGRSPDSSSSSSDSGDEMKQERNRAETKSLFSPVSVSLAPRRALDIKFDNSSSTTDEIEHRDTSVDNSGRKGLNALKALSLERKSWDAGIEPERGRPTPWSNTDLFFQGVTTSNYHSYGEDIKPLAKLPLPKSLLSNSSSADQSRARDSLSHFPQYRRRIFREIQPPQESPPPAPEVPPPDEEEEAAAGSRWILQNSDKQTWESMSSYAQEESTMDRFGPFSQFPISRGDGRENFSDHIGLLSATPYQAAKQYQSVTSASPETVTLDHNSSNTTSTTTSKHSTLYFDSYNKSVSDA